MSAALGTPVTFVIDHLTPDAARRIMTLFDRPRGSAKGYADLLEICDALTVLPHGEEYGQIIGLWTCLANATLREEWRRLGLELIAARGAPKPAPGPIVTRGRGVRRGRGRVVDARRAFGHGRRSR